MSVFDETTLNEEILKSNQFVNNGPNEWSNCWWTNLKDKDLRLVCAVSMRIDTNQNAFNVNIVVSAPYVQYMKRMRIEDSIEFYTLLYQLKDIEYNYLINEFQIVTVC